MKRIFTLIALFCSIAIIAQTTTTGNITHDGINRNYRLRLPANHDKNIPIPLVFNMHGYTSNAIQQEFYSGMNAVADTARFAVCYPNGVSSAWNVGWTFGSTADDVGFISAMIDKFHADHGIDKSRVYACGMSNGGFMSYRLACELNDKIAAIASVTGSMVKQALDTCEPGKAVPVMEIHGTEDATVNYEGTPNVSEAISKVLSFWQENNGCDKDPMITAMPNISATDNTTSEIWNYSNCDQSTELVHIKVINGGHTWPGSVLTTIGVTSLDFNASAEIWKFFRKFKLETPTASDDIKSETIKIYPNPVSNTLNVVCKPLSTIMINDISGRVVTTTQSESSVNVEISTTDWMPGIYFVRIISGSEQQTFKVVK